MPAWHEDEEAADRLWRVVVRTVGADHWHFRRGGRDVISTGDGMAGMGLSLTPEEAQVLRAALAAAGLDPGLLYSHRERQEAGQSEQYRAEGMARWAGLREICGVESWSDARGRGYRFRGLDAAGRPLTVTYDPDTDACRKE